MEKVNAKFVKFITSSSFWYAFEMTSRCFETVFAEAIPCVDKASSRESTAEDTAWASTVLCTTSAVSSTGQRETTQSIILSSRNTSVK